MHAALRRTGSLAALLLLAGCADSVGPTPPAHASAILVPGNPPPTPPPPAPPAPTDRIVNAGNGTILHYRNGVLLARFHAPAPGSPRGTGSVDVLDPSGRVAFSTRQGTTGLTTTAVYRSGALFQIVRNTTGSPGTLGTFGAAGRVAADGGMTASPNFWEPPRLGDPPGDCTAQFGALVGTAGYVVKNSLAFAAARRTLDLPKAISAAIDLGLSISAYLFAYLAYDNCMHGPMSTYWA